jgi:dienelactone hydrolase
MLILSALVVGAWGLGLAALTRSQARLIFGRPRVLRAAPIGPHGHHRTHAVRLETQDCVSLQGWLTLPPGLPQWLAVWFGGRNEDVGWTPAIASWLGPAWAVCAFNYRGSVGSTGSPGEAACVQDALAIAAWACAETGLPPTRVMLMGRSLGSGIAVQAAARCSAAGLVLLSPPASLRRLVMRNPLLLPALPWLRHPFDSLAVAPQIRVASLVVLAECDRRVPHAESRRLARALQGTLPAPLAKRSRVITIAGTDHRSLARRAEALAVMARFAGELATTPAPERRPGTPGPAAQGCDAIGAVNAPEPSP